MMVNLSSRNKIILKRIQALFIAIFIGMGSCSCIFREEDSLLRDIEKRKAPSYLVAEGWEEYFKAVTYLHEGGSRKRAAELFERVVIKYPDSNYSEESYALANLLKIMAKEELCWHEPNNVSMLSLDEQVSYYIYKIRDISCEPATNPVGNPLFALFRTDSNPAYKLKEIGRPAVPALIRLLDDARPTRSITWWRSYAASRYVLRYQDVALKILENIFAKEIWIPGTNIFSVQKTETRQKTIDEIKAYWEEIQEKEKQQTPEK